MIEVRRWSDQPTFSDADVTVAWNLAHEVTVALELNDTRAEQHRSRLIEAIDELDELDETDETDELDELDELDETVRQIRTTIFALNCSGSSARSLRRSVLEVAESVGSAFDLRPAVCFRGPVDILVDPGVVRDVEAVVREGVTNAGKHAAASLVDRSPLGGVRLSWNVPLH